MGQIGLVKEFSEGSIAVFMHRGDSAGESGSNVYYLSNKTSRYEGCGNRFDKIGYGLKDRALIISDGSNTSIRPLRRFHSSKVYPVVKLSLILKEKNSILGGSSGFALDGWARATGQRLSGG